MSPCPKCGHQAAADTTACPDCGQELTNGAVGQAVRLVGKPTPPAEVSGWVIHQLPPDVLAQERRAFDEQEFLAALREVERTGGLELKEFIHEIEQGVPSGE